ncbi:hypothetical protein SERLA73DRAFT_192341 [Serpula lacrymans var. lacrymans S7.3]|uniref:Uncharacterized protein n=1 Tax=Serpula lacrymans var. lacrymans (strain S7.3) TaxID=936435 RepID=F8QJX3_SERL3|nr:hypothetical protein SERLA73DRAFT_192341 [Serpula lacrymans var. lacrymans S7.3]
MAVQTCDITHSIYCSIPFFSFFDNLILYYLRRICQRTFLPSYSFSFFLHSYTVHSLLLFYYINPCILPCKNNKNSNPDFFSTLKFTTLLLVIQCGHNTSHFYHC